MLAKSSGALHICWHAVCVYAREGTGWALDGVATDILADMLEASPRHGRHALFWCSFAPRWCRGRGTGFACADTHTACHVQPGQKTCHVTVMWWHDTCQTVLCNAQEAPKTGTSLAYTNEKPRTGRYMGSLLTYSGIHVKPTEGTGKMHCRGAYGKKRTVARSLPT